MDNNFKDWAVTCPLLHELKSTVNNIRMDYDIQA